MMEEREKQKGLVARKWDSLDYVMNGEVRLGSGAGKGYASTSVLLTACVVFYVLPEDRNDLAAQGPVLLAGNTLQFFLEVHGDAEGVLHGVLFFHKTYIPYKNIIDNTLYLI